MKMTRLPCRLPQGKTPRQKYLARRRNDKITTVILQIGLLFALIGIWELAAKLDLIDPFITSCPSRIVKMLQTIDTSELFTHIAYTLIECIIGFIAASALGIVIAILLWRFVKLRKVLEPYIVVLNALPKIALGPIIIIWVGAGAQAIIVMTI
ncbi:MAG: ABC transporter permease, partial [Clostridiales bacterium]|nr:ABC transporter permease [Clostridiales bacterium]